jgi:NitT/TauT family transport system substrate-binding protein
MSSNTRHGREDAEMKILSRRSLLMAAGAAVPLAALGTGAAAGGITRPGALPADLAAPFICRAGYEGTAGAPLKRLKISWNATAVCLSPVAVAAERGIFAKHGLEVELVNYAGSTDQLLEAIATGKADAGVGMALRWLKPLEQGFDVKLTAGTHGGCMRLLAAKEARIESLEDLKGKTIAVGDMASPAKNFFAIMLAKRGLDPMRDVEWRQYPTDLLGMAVEKGEAHALAEGDPRTYLWLKEGKLVEVASNLSDEYANRLCCVLGVRGSLVRDDQPTATALTRAVLEAAQHTSHHPEDAATVFAPYAPKASTEDLAAMTRYLTHHHHPTGLPFKQEIALYAEELKLVSVFKPGTDPMAFAEKVYADVLTS